MDKKVSSQATVKATRLIKRSVLNDVTSNTTVSSTIAVKKPSSGFAQSGIVSNLTVVKHISIG